MYKQEYERWLASPVLSEAERNELAGIAADEREIESRFYAPLSFGTAGLRGTMAVGLNRMNVYIVRQTTQALANLVLAEGGAERGVAIACDCRINSETFAREAAAVLAANGVRVLLFDALRPTPELSFAVLKYGCIAGINITASHNPKEYNGYKAYWQDGAQLPPVHADTVEREIAKIDVLSGAKTMDFATAVASGIITILGAETDEAFLSCVMAQLVDPEPIKRIGKELTIVYTPFHGAGYKLVPEALRRAGFERILTVAEQMEPDGGFPTVVSPNPENPEGFALAVEYAKKHNANLIIGTDPDCDRVGVMVRDQSGEYKVLSGNQTGSILLDYLIAARKRTGKMPPKPFAVKTIVSSELPAAICEQNGVAIYNCFTGFKFIAEKINERQAEGETCIFSFEESFGYLFGDFTRDKDAVTASLLLAEMAVYYAERNMTLLDALDDLYHRIGWFSELTINQIHPGIDGLKNMAVLMENLRTGRTVFPFEVSAVADYKTGTLTHSDGRKVTMQLSGSNVLEYRLAGGTKLLVRPSGTEPKVKFYVLVSAKSREAADEMAEKIKAFVDTLA